MKLALAGALILLNLSTIVFANDPDDNLLTNHLIRFQNNYQNVDSVALYIVEMFCDFLGRRRLYHFTLRSYPVNFQPVRAKNVYNFLDEFGDNGVLNWTSDADALTFLWAKLIGTNAIQEKLRSPAEVELMMEVAPKQQCKVYLSIMGPGVFDRQEFKNLVANRDLLDTQLSKLGHTNEVRQFMLGWAHYQICRHLVVKNTDILVDKFIKRSDEFIKLNPNLPKEPGSILVQEANLMIGRRR